MEIAVPYKRQTQLELVSRTWGGGYLVATLESRKQAQMEFSIGNLVAGFVFGAVGLFFIRLAKKEGNLRALFFGIALCAFPYFIENNYLVWGIGIALVIIGYKQLDS